MSGNNLEGSTIQLRREGGISSPGSIASLVNSTSGVVSIPIQAAEVIDVIYNSAHPEFQTVNDIGNAKVRFLYDRKTSDEVTLSWACPMNSNIVQYPLKGEIVYTLNFLGRLFYINSLNYSNNVNNNSVKNISSSRVKEQDSNINNYQTTENTGISNKEGDNNDLGDTFVNNENKIKPLQPQEGDVIIQGRFGNAIRLGNNPETNTPNIKITVGQTPDNNTSDPNEPYVEDVNKNKSCIWITSDEIIPFTPITEGKSYNFKSAKTKVNKYEGNSVFINSDRLIFNAKREEILLFSNKGILLNTSGYVGIDSSDDIGITTLSKLNIEARGGTYVDSREIILGKNATDPLVLGNKFLDLFSNLLDELIIETHPTGTGPSGPPANAAKYRIIKNKLRTLLSKQNKTL
jgi:hypothetical protein